MTVRGLLLISHRGEAYFIEGGIRADKIADNLNENLSNLTIDSSRAVDAELALEGRLIPLAQVRTQATTWRTAWNNGNPDLAENVGPIIFQAFNVEAEIPEFGDAVITGSSTDFG
jgi:hypothetical protein